MHATHHAARQVAFYVLSAERGEHTPATNLDRTARLHGRLERLMPGYVRPAIGHTAQWGDEQSLILFVPRGDSPRVRAIVCEALRDYQQDAALYVTSERIAYQITGSSFSRTRLGRWQGVSGSVTDWAAPAPTGDYTECDGAYYTIVPDGPSSESEGILP